jgi:hypothetical protein
MLISLSLVNKTAARPGDAGSQTSGSPIGGTISITGETHYAQAVDPPVRRRRGDFGTRHLRDVTSFDLDLQNTRAHPQHAFNDLISTPD